MRYLSLLLVFIATCWSHEKAETVDPSSTSSSYLLELPPEIIHEIEILLDYSHDQTMRLVSKKSKELFKGRGKIIKIISAIEKHSLEFTKGLLAANSEVSGINFGYNDCWLGQLNTILPTMRFLKELEFRYLKLTAENIAAITSVQNLETLRINHLNSLDTPHPPSPMDFLNSLATLPKLTGLHLMSYRFSSHSQLINFENIITALQNIKNLRELTLCNMISGQIKLEYFLYGLEKLTSLTELNLELDWNLLDSYDSYSTPYLPNLKKFSVICHSKGQHINANNTMRNLNLLDLSFIGAYFDRPIVIEHLSNLTALNLKGSFIGSQDKEFESVCSLPNLIELDLSYCYHIPTAKFTCLEKLTKLQDLNLEKTDIDKTGIKAISTLTRMKKLNLQHCTLISYERLCHLIDLTSLQELDINFINIGPLTIKCIGGFFRNLVKLSLGARFGNSNIDKLSDENFKYFKFLINLQYLNAQNVCFNDESIAIISKLPNLQHLYLSSCENISVDGFNHFRNTTNLKFLCLGGFKADETCFDILSKHPNLRTLNISSAPQVTKAFLSAIKSLYPNLRIH